MDHGFVTEIDGLIAQVSDQSLQQFFPTEERFWFILTLHYSCLDEILA
jgi:hypothetical protein